MLLSDISLTGISASSLLQGKLVTKQARVGVLGLGYVGLPLAVEFARAGFDVIGIDVLHSKVEQVNAGQSYIKDIPDSSLQPWIQCGKLRATTDLSVIRTLDTIDICVPTPLRQNQRSGYEFCGGGG